MSKITENLYDYIKKTPILNNFDIDEMTGCKLFFKCENLQTTGSFKYRGACNAVMSLDKKRREGGIVTVSSGNHGAALAKVGKIFNVKTHIIVPENSSPFKIDNIKKQGAAISYCGNDFKDRKVELERVQKETGFCFIPPYNDMNVINGQATVAKEMIEEIFDLEAIFCPIGGGGLISGTIMSRDKIKPNLEIYGCEPEGANDAFLSLKTGKLITDNKANTICDGLRACLGDITYPIIRKGVKSIITVKDEDVLKAMQIIWENLKIIVEPSSAITLAAVIQNKKSFKGKKVGLILSGGNIILDKILWKQ